GDPGIGKSRLLHEFRQSLSGEGITYLEGRCVSYGSATPYLPVLDIVRHQCGIGEGDSPQLITDKVGLCLEEIGMTPEGSAPYLLHLLGLKEGTQRLAMMSPEAIKAETIKIFRQMGLNASRRRPVVLVVEDLQWIDKTSEECLASLVEGLASARVLLLSTYRPGYRPQWIEKSYATQISLQPLSSQESLNLLESLSHTEDVAQNIAQQIVAKAEGNPFFLEELARAVQEQDASPSDLLIPDTVQEVLLARIERLGEHSKRLLQTASVLGREFSLRLLNRMADGPGQIDEPLEELKRLEFLYEQTGTDEPIYAFKHALTQEVAYQALVPSHRQALHEAAGKALETLYAGRFEEAYDRLAYHFSKTDDAEKAIDYLSRFAEKAARSYAHAEAVTALKEALAHAQQLPAAQRDRCVLELVLRQVDSLHFLARFSEILDVLHEQQERVDRLSDPSLACRYYFLLGRTCGLVGDHEHAVQWLNQTIEQARQCADKATMGKAYVSLAIESCFAGQFRRGVECGQQAVTLLQPTEELYWLGCAHWNVAINSGFLGDFQAGSRSAVQARRIAESIANPRLRSYAAWIAGMIYAFKGEWDLGIKACEQSIDFAQDPFNRALALGFCGAAYLEKRTTHKAIPPLEQSIQQFGPALVRQMQSWFMIMLGEAHLLNGDIEKAHGLALQGLHLASEMKYQFGVAWAYRALGRIAQARGEFKEAATYFTAALETFTSVEARFEMARTQLTLAEVAQAQGNQEAAGAHLQAAYELFETLKVTHYVGRTVQLAAKLGIILT
ncbi:MAG TPA: tetratricopeptide repeat protein, partial [Methylomirabilota bacterium]|nr:tetratricopeptide repeat protein [Methylomirabilota bacterium]